MQLSQRQTINYTQPIDVSKIPTCPTATCKSDPLGSISPNGCTPVTASTQLYNRSCYCALKDPLYCAWECTWWEWMFTEDWFVKECGPNSDRLSYDGLPACAQGCLHEQLVYYGCVTEGRNCFCIQGSLFNCQSNCHKESETIAIQHWLMAQCGISKALAEKGTLEGVFYGSTADLPELKESLAVFRPRRTKLKWYEVGAIVLLCITVLVGVIMWIDLRVRQRKQSQAGMVETQEENAHSSRLWGTGTSWKAVPGDVEG
ncbi:uncharacterized protein Z520_09120 [Fonsecaea multimorphosa CBS 102226]|uniref:Uncharacterized protein n=1 Tax=Fonsecaea multimorphosa CBS 102226 TaxID=1442371 RepID=A0A0D2JXE6_9EURO|nr:uncharacterized protein Z520_09120 [Fonsecaea multimorphosa CBS 102226]KIX95204.1 hypothetical protein Z520_09120 [Fonsecaea multimorphosa CBS 102226]